MDHSPTRRSPGQKPGTQIQDPYVSRVKRTIRKKNLTAAGSPAAAVAPAAPAAPAIFVYFVYIFIYFVFFLLAACASAENKQQIIQSGYN